MGAGLSSKRPMAQLRSVFRTGAFFFTLVITMKTFTEENVGLFYLSPYTQWQASANGGTLYNSLYSRAVELSGDESYIQELLAALRQGVTENELLTLMRPLSIQLTEWISKGIIE